jgi:branched-chain amino acid transport system permease protein
MDLVLIQILNGLQYGLPIFLAASGLTLIFGIMGIINLSRTARFICGAYLPLTLTSMTGDIFLSLALGIPIAFLFGAAIEWLFIRHLYERDHLQQVLPTFGLILVFNELQRICGNVSPQRADLLISPAA